MNESVVFCPLRLCSVSFIFHLFLLFILGQLTASDSVSPVPRPAWIPDLVSPQSDGILHGTLNGPSAANRRLGEEKSPRY